MTRRFTLQLVPKPAPAVIPGTIPPDTPGIWPGHTPPCTWCGAQMLIISVSLDIQSPSTWLYLQEEVFRGMGNVREAQVWMYCNECWHRSRYDGLREESSL